MKRYLLTTAIAVGLATPALAVETTDVLDTYADIAAANYGDSLITAQRLQAAVNALVADPSAENLTAARAAWLGLKPSKWPVRKRCLTTSIPLVSC